MSAKNEIITFAQVADDGWDEKVFDGIMYHKNNGTNYYLTDKLGDLYLVKGSD